MSNVIKSRKVVIDLESFYLKSTKDNEEDMPKAIENEEPEVDYEDIYKQKLNDLELRESQMIEQAKLEADNIIKEAESNRENIFNQARQDGYNSGYEEGQRTGYEQGYNESRQIIDEAVTIKETSKMQMDEYLYSLEGQVVELVIDSVKKMIDTISKENEDLIINLIHIGLRKITASDNLIIKVSQDDVEVVRECKNSILAGAPNIESIVVKEDLSLSKGDCLIITESGEVDSGLKTQLTALEELLRSYMKNE